MDWRAFSDDDSANRLRELCKEHTDQPPDDDDEGDAQDAQEVQPWLTAGTSGWVFNDRDTKT